MTENFCNCCGGCVEPDEFDSRYGYCVECISVVATPWVIRQTKKAQQQGEYKPTEVDAAKKDADFRVTAAGNRWTITWKDGRTERVTDAQLGDLQAAHTWAVDF